MAEVIAMPRPRRGYLVMRSPVIVGARGFPGAVAIGKGTR